MLPSLGWDGSKRKNLRAGEFEDVDKAVCSWFVVKRSQQVTIDKVLLKEKALNFEHVLGETECKASDCWLSNWKRPVYKQVALEYDKSNF